MSRPSTNFAVRKSALLAVTLGFTVLSALPAAAIPSHLISAHAINALIPHSSASATVSHPISISHLPTSVINQLTPANLL